MAIELASLDPREIVVGHRARDLNLAAVERLKESITKLGGIKTPLSVRLISEEEGWGLVAGRHRLQAAIELDMDRVPVREENGTELDARLWEIAENLHRAELTDLEEKEHIAEWIRLSEERERIKAQVAPMKKPHDRGRPNQGINAASRELGIERTEAQRAVKVAALAPEAKEEARALGLDDNQSALLDAAKHSTKEEQIRALRERNVKRDSAGRQQPARKSGGCTKQIAPEQQPVAKLSRPHIGAPSNPGAQAAFLLLWHLSGDERAALKRHLRATNPDELFEALRRELGGLEEDQ